VAFAITARFMTAGGGAVARFVVAAFSPSTLCRVGAIATRGVTGAEATCCVFTAMVARATGCEFTKAFCGTAVTAPCTVLFTYVTLVMFVDLLTTVVL